MTFQADLYLSMRNPNSYLVAGMYRKMTERYALEISVKPVYPLAIRDPNYFEETSPLWVPYLIKDCHRFAAFHDITFALAEPDPIAQNLDTLSIADEQPYIHRLTRLAAMAADRSKDVGMAFAHELLHLLWSGEVKGWDQGQHLANVSKKAGLELSLMDAAIAKEPDRYESIVIQNQSDLDAAGHWYVPSFVFDGELFFGDSRVDQALWWMKRQGLQARQA